MNSTDFSVSSIILKNYYVSVSDLYTIIQFMMMFMCFFGLPYSYFFAKNVQDNEEQNLFNKDLLQTPLDDENDGLLDNFGKSQGNLGIKGFDSSTSEDE